MKSISISLLSLTAASILLTGCCTHPAPSAWEYRDVVLDTTKHETLNDYAKDGWVVVSSYYDPKYEIAHYVLKRHKR